MNEKKENKNVEVIAPGDTESVVKKVGKAMSEMSPDFPVLREEVEVIAQEVMQRLVNERITVIGEELESKYQNGIEEFVTEIAGRLTRFIYILLRNELPVGKVNGIIKDQVGKGMGMYSDDILRVKAESLAIMIIRDEYLVTEVEAAINMPDPQ